MVGWWPTFEVAGELVGCVQLKLAHIVLKDIPGGKVARRATQLLLLELVAETRLLNCLACRLVVATVLGLVVSSAIITCLTGRATEDIVFPKSYVSGI